MSVCHIVFGMAALSDPLAVVLIPDGFWTFGGADGGSDRVDVSAAVGHVSLDFELWVAEEDGVSSGRGGSVLREGRCVVQVRARGAEVVRDEPRVRTRRDSHRERVEVQQVGDEDDDEGNNDAL